MIISYKYRFIFIKTSKVGGTSLELMLDKVCGNEDVFCPHWHEETDFTARNYVGFFNPLPEIKERFKGCHSIQRNGSSHTWRNFLKKKKFFENIPAWQLKCRLPGYVWEDFFKFTIERNPWDKCISRYYHSKRVYESKYGKELTFPMWFEYFENRLKTPWITTAWGSEAPYNFPRYADPWTDKVLVDKICYYENLTEEFDILFERLGVPFNGFEQYRAKADYRKDKQHYSKAIPFGYKDRIADIFKKEIEIMGYSF